MIQKIDEVLTQMTSLSKISIPSNLPPGLEIFQGRSDAFMNDHIISPDTYQQETNQADKTQDIEICFPFNGCNRKSKNEKTALDNFEKLKNQYSMQALRKYLFYN